MSSHDGALERTERFVHELRTLLAAPYPILHLHTHEEERARTLLEGLAAEANRPMWCWSPTYGFGDHSAQEEGSGQADMARALDAIAASDVHGIFVFLDAATLIEQLDLRRRLREIAMAAATRHVSMVFIGPVGLEHPELSKEVTRLTMPLPGRRELLELAGRVFGPQGSPRQTASLHAALVSGALGLTHVEAARAYRRVQIARAQAIEAGEPFDLEASILDEKRRLIAHHDALEFHPLDEGVGDIGGLGALKSWLDERREAFSPRAREFGLPAPRGLLLVGVQGCGKSLTAKAVGRAWGLPLLRLDLGRVFDGQRAPEETMRVALQLSEALAPCVMWIDEIEKGFTHDSEGRARRVLGGLLTWLQEKSSPVFLVATANQVDELPPELLRKGRFDEIFFVDLPDLHDRKEIVRIHLQKRARSMSTEVIEDLAARCEYFSGSELEQVVISALYSAFAQGRDLESDDLIYAARSTVPLYKTYEEQIKALREWAEHRARPASSKRRVLDFFQK